MPTKIKHKYHAVPTIINGIRFASKLEAKRYLGLKHLQKIGVVKEFTCQPRFVIHDGFVKDGKKVQPITYVADFDVTYTNGKRIIEDTKGVMTETFKIKQKLFWKRYPDLELVIIKKCGKMEGV